MKIILSIQLSLLIIFSGINVHYSAHYCGGSIAATRISLSGQLATCGMESTSEEKSTELLYKSHCCEDVVTSFILNNNYKPSLPVIQNSFQPIFTFPGILTGFSVNYVAVTKSIYSNANPPGALRSSGVDLSDICVFRI